MFYFSKTKQSCYYYFFFMTVDTFGFKLAYTSGLYGAPILAVSIDARPTPEIEHQCVVYRCILQ